MEINIVHIDTEFVTLGQFLQMADLIQSGGMAKAFLQNFLVYINDDEYAEERRGKKLYHGDLVDVEEVGVYQIHSRID